MARYLIFCEEEIPKKILGRSSKYSYKKGILRVFRYSTLIYEGKAEPREAFEVICTQKGIKVRPLHPPTERILRLAWLCGIAHMAVCKTLEDYEERLSQYKDFNSSLHDTTEWEVQGNSYRIKWSKKGLDTARPYCIACFISKEITIPEILELLPIMRNAGYPDWYLFEILNRCCSVTKEDFDEAIARQA